MTNLLRETIEVLSEHGKMLNDIEWIGFDDHVIRCGMGTLLGVEYDNGFGYQEIRDDLVVVGKDWWLERHEYDGSEWWEYKEMPVKPDKRVYGNADLIRR